MLLGGSKFFSLHLRLVVIAMGCWADDCVCCSYPNDALVFTARPVVGGFFSLLALLK